MIKIVLNIKIENASNTVSLMFIDLSNFFQIRIDIISGNWYNRKSN